MSFRGRLTLFFVLIVVLPMIAVGVLVTQVTDASRSAKADARLDAGLDTATNIYRDDLAAAVRAAKAIGSDPDLGDSLRADDTAALRNDVARLAVEQDAVAVTLRAPDGRVLASLGPTNPVAATETQLTSGARELGSLLVSTTAADDYLGEVHRLTGREAALATEDGPTSATLDLDSSTDIPADGDSEDVSVGSDDLRVASAALPGAGDLRVALFGPIESRSFFASSPGVIAAIAAFFLVALLFVVAVQRTLQAQVAAMLDAAHRIGAGDFSRKVPVVGRDEMAGLASEFNKMSDQLEAQMAELRRQQVEIDRSIRRIGEAFAAGLDRSALLEILAETAISASSAEYGLIALTGREGAEAEVGISTDELQDAVLAAEADANRSGELAEVNREGAHALSGPLRRIGEPGSNIGVMTVARRDEPFGPGERDVFLYLIGQAAASIENVALHELVSEQAVTDDLTQLSNKRAFRNFAEREAARAKRFKSSLSLLVLDIDDFKQVNDTHGHLQGDEVLRRVARALDAESREIDMPARYGGEEFVVGLPETGLQGAEELAERVRERIAGERVPLVGTDGTLKVTASIGVASLPDSAGDVESLIAAADAALYAAKRGGKNKVVVASAATTDGALKRRAMDGAGTEGKPRIRRT
jgi:diguanylate cyclase (GGDEF)-like protein